MINFDKYEAVIGLEVHAQLSTETKFFCGCSASYGHEPNTKVDPVCLGLPGALPALNQKAVEYAIKVGLALQCKIAKRAVFARKNYFYPDLPKGYQISQFNEPLCEHGYLEVDLQDYRKKVHIERIHLEEDAGKSIHSQSSAGGEETLIDLNRCGIPLIEIVSEPDFRTPEEAGVYLTALREIVQYLGVCNGNMEEGNLRCDANVSIRLKGETRLGVKTELKNMNSIRGVKQAIHFEIGRQIKILQEGGSVLQQTLLWNADKKAAKPMRAKEKSADYRYLPDPDLVPVQIDESWLNEIAMQMPELPEAKRTRFTLEYQLPQDHISVLTSSPELADYFEMVAMGCGDAKAAANWMVGEVLRQVKENNQTVENCKVTPDGLIKLIKLVRERTVSLTLAKQVFSSMAETGQSASEIIKKNSLFQIFDSDEVRGHVLDTLANNPSEVKKILAGNQQVLGYLVGQVMRSAEGKADPKVVAEILTKELANLGKG